MQILKDLGPILFVNTLLRGSFVVCAAALASRTTSAERAYALVHATAVAFAFAVPCTSRHSIPCVSGRASFGLSLVNFGSLLAAARLGIAACRDLQGSTCRLLVASTTLMQAPVHHTDSSGTIAFFASNLCAMVLIAHRVDPTVAAWSAIEQAALWAHSACLAQKACSRWNGHAHACSVASKILNAIGPYYLLCLAAAQGLGRDMRGDERIALIAFVAISLACTARAVAAGGIRDNDCAWSVFGRFVGAQSLVVNAWSHVPMLIYWAASADGHRCFWWTLAYLSVDFACVRQEAKALFPVVSCYALTVAQLCVATPRHAHAATYAWIVVLYKEWVYKAWRAPAPPLL